MKKILMACVLVGVLGGSVYGSLLQQFSSSQSIVMGGAARMAVVVNTPDKDYTLRLYDNAGRYISVLRLYGPDAEENIQLVSFLLSNLFASWGVVIE